MHYELLLHAPVPAHRHNQIVQVLAGVTAQPPQRTRRRCYVFSPTRMPPASKTAQNQGGGSQEIASNKRHTKEAGTVYMLRLEHKEEDNDKEAEQEELSRHGPDQVMGNTDRSVTIDGEACATTDENVKAEDSDTWQLHYYDTPEPGKKSVTGRSAQVTDIVNGDAVKFVEGMGYSCTAQYLTDGHFFVHQNILLHLYRILPLPFTNPTLAAVDTLPEPPISATLPSFDSNGGYLLEAKVTLVDGGQPDLVQQGTQELTQFRDRMKGCLDLRAADRLSLDTKITVR